MKKKAARALCLVLCTALLVSLLPLIRAEATEADTPQSPSSEVSVPEEPKEPIQEEGKEPESAPPQDPSEEITDPGEDPTAPAGETTAPGENATDPAEEPSAPEEDPTDPTEEAVPGTLPDLGINALSEAPATRSIGTNERGNITFQTLADLIELTSRTYSEYTIAEGSEDLVIGQDVTIPENLDVSLKNVTVSEGATLRMVEGSSLSATHLTVAGTVEGGAIFSGKGMDITGSVILNGTISVDGTAKINGIEKIQFVTEESGIFHQAAVSTFGAMKEIIAAAAAETNSHVSYVMNIQTAGITVEESVTVPDNVTNYSLFGTLTIPSGVTMTTTGNIMIPPKFGHGGSIQVQSGGTLVCGALDAMNDCAVDGTLTASSLRVDYGSAFTVNGAVTVNGEASVGLPSGGGSLNINGSMRCGSMAVDTGSSSVALAGELKISNFSSLEALGLDESYYTATQGSDGFTLISSRSSSLKQDLDDLANEENASPEEIKEAVQEKSTEIKEALNNPADADAIIDKIAELEIKASGSTAAVEVTQSQQTQIDRNRAFIEGATLNKVENAAAPVKLVVDKATRDDNTISPQYDKDTAVTFSMTLENVENPENLSVPVRITLPVPDGFSTDDLTILHYNKDGSVKEQLPFTANADKTAVSFVVTGFSDFAMVKKVETPATCEHTWNDGEVTVKATCTKPGVMTYACTLCGEKKTEKTDKAEHTWGAWENADENNHARTCTVCGSKSVPEAHTWGAWEKVDDKEHKQVCTGCGTTKTEEHTWDKAEVTKEATCKETGVRTYTCKCGLTKTEEIPVSDVHTYDDKWTDSGDGKNHQHVCTVCGKEPVQEAHKWNSGMITKKPTCTEKGEKTYTCQAKGCGATKAEELPMTDHEYTAKYEDKEDGKTHIAYCTCGLTKEEKHDFSINGKVTVKPTTAKEGKQEMLCVCGAKTVKTLPKKEADLDDVPKTGDITDQLVLGGVAIIAVLACAWYLLRRKLAK